MEVDPAGHDDRAWRSIEADEQRGIRFRHTMDDHIGSQALALACREQLVEFARIGHDIAVLVDRHPTRPVPIDEFALHDSSLPLGNRAGGRDTRASGSAIPTFVGDRWRIVQGGSTVELRRRVASVGPRSPPNASKRGVSPLGSLTRAEPAEVLNRLLIAHHELNEEAERIAADLLRAVSVMQVGLH